MNAALPELRSTLLSLHRTVIDAEKQRYETMTGTRPSPHQWWHLFSNDPSFAWLRPLSQLIVAMDEALDERKPAPPEVLVELVAECRQLLTGQDDADQFGPPYRAALQNDPAIVMAHAEVMRVLSSAKQA